MAQTLKVDKAFNPKIVQQMLQHFRIYNFIKTLPNKTIKFGFITGNLKEFIRREWVSANMVSSDQLAFLFHSSEAKGTLKTAFRDIKKFSNADFVSIVEIDRNYNNNSKPLPEPKTAVELVSNQFKNQSGTILRNQCFCPPDEGLNMFFKKQREHKVWWRKLSALPARFFNSKISNDEKKKCMISEIQAQFPWGTETVETIKYFPEFGEHDKNFFEEQSSKQNKFKPQVVICETILENMTFTYLCDSYENLNGENDRNVLSFNKRLAPFKVSIAGFGDSIETVKKLEELSLLLAKQVRKSGHSVLRLPDVCTTPLDRQVLRNDALGVPYTILLNEKTLKDGIIALRNRDTTLEEQSHVGLIADYLNKILN